MLRDTPVGRRHGGPVCCAAMGSRRHAGLGVARHAWTGALVAGALALACSPSAEPAPGGGSATGRPDASATSSSGVPPEGPELVVLVSIDTLRPDRLGAYGHSRATSPHLDALAREGVLFEQAMAPSPWTLPSHGSLLTGRYPRGHGLKSADAVLPAGLPTLAEQLGRAGFATAGFVNSAYLSQRHGLHRGFDVFRYVPESVERVRPMTFVTDLGLEWLSEAPAGRRFLFLHYYDVHSDYRSLPEFEARFVAPYEGPFDGSTAQLLRLRRDELVVRDADVAHLLDRYDAGVAQMDREIGRLLAALRGRPEWERTLLVVTSDHGEEFHEHGGFLHGRTQYQEVLAVPLLVRGPGLPAGRRISEPVSLVDVVPTLLSAVRAPVPAGLDGIDLGPGLRGAPLPRRPLFGEADHHNVRPDVTRSVRLGAEKLVIDRGRVRRGLYDLAADPAEQHDLQAEAPERLRALRRLLDAYESGEVVAPGSVELSREERAHLERLGYLQAERPQAPGPDAAPVNGGGAP